jgi:cysteine desulfurase
LEFYSNSGGISNDSISANRVLDDARESVKDILGLSNYWDLTFTSSATESNNTVISSFKNAFILSSPVEHKSVLESINYYCPNHIYVNVNQWGHVELGELKLLLSDIIPTTRKFNRKFGLIDQPMLVSLMHVNNELGTILDLPSLMEILDGVREYYPAGLYLHVDASQSLGKLSESWFRLGVDYITGSAHKFNGLKGIGLLACRTKEAFLKLRPLLYGGNQQPLRSSTMNVAGILSTEVALKELNQDETFYDRSQQFRRIFLDNVYDGIKLNSSIHGVPWCINMFVPGLDADEYVMSNATITCSTSSACTSGSVHPSHVLRACGYDDKYISSCVRLSTDPLSITNPGQEGLQLAEAFNDSITSFR